MLLPAAELFLPNMTRHRTEIAHHAPLHSNRHTEPTATQTLVLAPMASAMLALGGKIEW